MVQMVKVTEERHPGGGYSAAIPGLPGGLIRAASLPELRARLRAALTHPNAAPQAPVPPAPKGTSSTELYLML